MADVTTALARFALAEPDAPAALNVVRLSLLDWAAVGLAGTDEPVSQMLREAALEDGGRAEASVIGCATKLPGRQACLVNGATSHALDYDDTHFAHIGHPSVAIIPSALAAAERAGADMAAFQAACLVGVEASVRAGVWLGRGHYQTGFHQTATAGAFGATVAAGRLLGLNDAQMENALGLASTRASGLKSQFGTMGKPMNAGIAAQNGYEAALLAARGFVSAPDGLEGAQGFGQTHHGAGDMSAFDGMGADWQFETVQHKFHACCHGLHATLEALKSLPVDTATLDQITVHTHPRWMSVCNKVNPTTGLEAKFSYRMVIAMALTGHDTARLDSFSDALCRDPAVLALCDKVQVLSDDSLSEMQARLVLTQNGAESTAFHDLDVVPDYEVRRDKVQAKASSLLNSARACRIWAVLNDQPDLGAFLALLRAE